MSKKPDLNLVADICEALYTARLGGPAKAEMLRAEPLIGPAKFRLWAVTAHGQEVCATLEYLYANPDRFDPNA